MRRTLLTNFYRGKRITFVIGYGPGGGYDLYARMLGRFIGAHIPGNPFIVPQNMPGAWSRSAANWLFKVAARDGTIIACLSQATPIDQVLEEPGVQFDSRKFNWIGNLNICQQHPLCLIGKRRYDFGTGQDQTTLNWGHRRDRSLLDLSASVEQPVGHKIQDHRWLTGRRRYQYRRRAPRAWWSFSDSRDSLKATHADWLRNHLVNILFQVGPRRAYDLPDAPLWSELAENGEQLNVLSLLSGDISVGRPVLTAPDVPADRIGALRRAFEETLRDHSS